MATLGATSRIQRSECFRDADLGLEDPAVAPMLTGTLVVVLAERNLAPARSLHDDVLLVGVELLERQRRSAVQVDLQAEARIGEAVDLARLRHPEKVAVRRASCRARPHTPWPTFRRD
jgi:hypothetical protein